MIMNEAATMKNQPLSINVRVFDVESDKEESKRIFEIRKAMVEAKYPIESEADLERIKKSLDHQRIMLDKKWKLIQDLIIWAMNNRKELVFIAAGDDVED